MGIDARDLSYGEMMMVEQDNPTPPSDTASRGSCTGGRRGAFFLTAAAVTGILVGAFATSAMSHGPMFRDHVGHGRGGLHMAHFGGPIDPARAEQRAERMAKHLSVEVDASTEQQEKLAGITKAAVKDLIPLREKMLEGRKRGIDLLGQPTVDRAALEALRAEQMANIEAISKRISQALGDAAEVLKPEQRKALADRLEDFRAHRGWWHRG